MADDDRAKVFEFADDHKDAFRALAASMSFVGVCGMMFGVLTAIFALVMAFASAVAGAVTTGAIAGIELVVAWWTMASGRSLQAIVRTRGSDVMHLMTAVTYMRRIYGFQKIVVIVAAATLVAIAGVIVWCSVWGAQTGKCPMPPIGVI
jgi:hypothetical protein